ncbi:MAG: AAA family ATPase [Candidatus Solibacter sp.]
MSPKYLAELNRLPRLEQLGDGIRSFAATAIAARVGSHPIFLIDEPEAFLHPPQAARLGQVLGSLIAQQRRQAVVATHSADFVRGALLGSTEVAICRLERKGELNNASLLDADQVRQLWSSPLLRSSQAITGMFHEGVVVCEADADARFYEGILASVENRFSRPVDLYFVHGGGKGALASLARAYRQLEIPTVVIADLDLLKNEPEYFAVYAALGGTFADIQALYRSTASALAKSRPPLLPKTDPARL